MSEFIVTRATAAFEPNAHQIALIIEGRSAQGETAGSFELILPVAEDLHRSLGISLHLAECRRRGVVPVTERTA